MFLFLLFFEYWYIFVFEKTKMIEISNKKLGKLNRSFRLDSIILKRGKLQILESCLPEFITPKII